MSTADLRSVAERHAFNSIHHSPKVIGLKLGVLDTLLCPVLVQSCNTADRRLEENQLVPHALLYENATSVLVDDGLLVLRQRVSSSGREPCKG